MTHRIDTIVNSNELNNFLVHFENKSQIELLEGAKKNEIIEIAKAKGILLKDSIDLAGIKIVYVFPNKANKNKERIPKDELLRRLPLLIGKPMNLEHIRRNVIGYFIDYRYIEKENKVIAYAIIFKNVFKQEWDSAVELFKKGKLTTSYEIWRDITKDEKLSDGTSLYHDLIPAGGALLMREKPAFAGCKVLATAKKFFEDDSNLQLVYACVNKEGICKYGEENLVIANEGTMVKETPQTAPQVQKIVCGNCSHNFENRFTPGALNEISCPNCFAILDLTGKMIYPPQLKNFNLSCSQCQARNNWRILERGKEHTKVKCLGCSSEYKIKFKDESIKMKYVKMLTALKYVKVRCLQCGTYNEKYLPSTQQIINVKCKKCGLTFSFDTSHKSIKEIESIEKIEKPKGEDKRMDSVIVEAKLEFDEKEIDEFEKDVCGLVESKTTDGLFNCECLKCGKVIKTDKHCNTIKCPKCDGDMRRLKRPGKGQPVNSQLTTEQRKALPDSSFAVVITVKNKKTGKPRKIRKYPIHDKAHVRNALARLGQDAPKAELKRLGISVKSVIRKVLRRAKELGMTELLKRRKKAMDRKLLRKAVKKIRTSKKEAELAKANLEKNVSKMEKFVGGIKKFANLIRGLRTKVKESEVSIASLKKEVGTTKDFYLANAKKVIERRTELGDFAKDIKDEDLADDTKFELAKAKKIIAEKETKSKPELKTASLNIGDKDTEDQYAENRKIIDEKAFGHTKKTA